MLKNAMRLSPILLAGLMTGAAASDMTVQVVGEGETTYEAQMDAVRQAMQRRLPQILSADREIVNDEVVMDRITSSLNGYVREVRVLAERRLPDGRVRMDAQITVSPDEIRDYARRMVSGGAALSGRSIMAEVRRENGAREFRSTFLGRFFRGYPYQAVQPEIVGFKPTMPPDGTAVLKVRYRLDTRFIAGLREAARALACPAKNTADPSCSPQAMCFYETVKKTWGRDTAEWRCTVLAAAAGEQGRYEVLDLLDGSGDLGFALRFRKADGARLARDGRCFDWQTAGTTAPLLNRNVRADRHHGHPFQAERQQDIYYETERLSFDNEDSAQRHDIGRKHQLRTAHPEGARRQPVKWMVVPNQIEREYLVSLDTVGADVGDVNAVEGIDLMAVTGSRTVPQRAHQAQIHTDPVRVAVLSRFDFTQADTALYSLVRDVPRANSRVYPQLFERLIEPAADAPLGEEYLNAVRQAGGRIHPPQRLSRAACLWPRGSVEPAAPVQRFGPRELGPLPAPKGEAAAIEAI